MLDNILPFAHRLLAQATPAGGTAIDATAGNGHDTLFLAQCVGANGRVYAFDIQPQALAAALAQAVSLLRPGGLLAAVLYPGHAAGELEAEAVSDWAASLPQRQFAVLRYGFINRRNRPPYLLAIEKLSRLNTEQAT